MDFVIQLSAPEKGKSSSILLSKGGRKRKRASPALSAVEGLVCLDITSISVISLPDLVRNSG